MSYKIYEIAQLTSDQPVILKHSEQPATKTISNFNPVEDYINKHINLNDGIQTNQLFWIIAGLFATGRLLKLLPFFKAAKAASANFIFVSKEELALKDEIDGLCNRLLAITGSDRIVLGFFHNGTQNALGIHEKKISAMFEVTRRLKPIKDAIKAIPIERLTAELMLCDTSWQTVIKSEYGTMCDAYLDRMDSIQKDFKYLSRGGKHLGVVNVFYLEKPKVHFLDATDEGKELAKEVNATMSKLEYSLLLYLKPDESISIKLIHRAKTFLGLITGL